MENNTFIDSMMVTEVTNLQLNVKNIDKFIIEAQRLYIEIALGRYTTSILLDRYVRELVIVNTIEAEIIEDVKLALCYFTMTVLLPNIHYKVTENGVLTRNSGDNEPLEPKELEYRITQYKKNGDIFLNRAIDMLEENKHLFPHYSNKAKAKLPDRPNTIGGILFRDYRRCN